jgi:hypothetical protein
MLDVSRCDQSFVVVGGLLDPLAILVCGRSSLVAGGL